MYCLGLFAVRDRKILSNTDFAADTNKSERGSKMKQTRFKRYAAVFMLVSFVFATVSPAMAADETITISEDGAVGVMLYEGESKIVDGSLTINNTAGISDIWGVVSYGAGTHSVSAGETLAVDLGETNPALGCVIGVYGDGPSDSAELAIEAKNIDIKAKTDSEQGDEIIPIVAAGIHSESAETSVASLGDMAIYAAAHDGTAYGINFDNGGEGAADSIDNIESETGNIDVKADGVYAYGINSANETLQVYADGALNVEANGTDGEAYGIKTRGDTVIVAKNATISATANTAPAADPAYPAVALGIYSEGLCTFVTSEEKLNVTAKADAASGITLVNGTMTSDVVEGSSGYVSGKNVAVAAEGTTAASGIASTAETFSAFATEKFTAKATADRENGSAGGIVLIGKNADIAAKNIEIMAEAAHANGITANVKEITTIGVIDSETTADTITITANGTDEAYGVYTDAGSVLAVADAVKITAAGNNSFGVYAKGINSQLTVTNTGDEQGSIKAAFGVTVADGATAAIVRMNVEGANAAFNAVDGGGSGLIDGSSAKGDAKVGAISMLNLELSESEWTGSAKLESNSAFNLEAEYSVWKGSLDAAGTDGVTANIELDEESVWIGAANIGNGKLDVLVEDDSEWTMTGDVNFGTGTLTNKGTLRVLKEINLTGTVDTPDGNFAFVLDGHKPNDRFIINSTMTDLKNAGVELEQETQGTLLAKGEKMTLITQAEKFDYEEISVRTGIKKYLYGAGIENSALMLTGLGESAADETKSFSEARLAGSATLNNASDLIAGQAIDSASSGDSWEAFAAIQGSHNRYETGSHIDLNGINVAAGLSKKVKDNVTLGIFVEGGNGRYTTYNEFEDGDVRADGDINYFGGGIFAKVEGKKTAKGQFHGEASFRAGHMNSDYNSETFDEGELTRFDTSQAYLGAHIGLGYKWALKEGDNVDTYVKYLWNRQNSDSPTIAGEKFDLDAINSHRLRTGFRYNSKENAKGIKFYGGLAYEYEFDGVAKGRMGEYAILEPDYKGGSGIAEIGFKYHKANSPWKVDLGLTGATGKRDSIGVNLGAWYEFGK